MDTTSLIESNSNNHSFVQSTFTVPMHSVQFEMQIYEFLHFLGMIFLSF